MKIGLKIRKIRQQKDIKQEELANFLKISQGQLSKIENGTNFITFEQVINIANYTNTSLIEFLPEDITILQQLDFKIQLEELHNQNNQKQEIINQLLKRIKNLEQDLSNIVNK